MFEQSGVRTGLTAVVPAALVSPTALETPGAPAARSARAAHAVQNAGDLLAHSALEEVAFAWWRDWWGANRPGWVSHDWFDAPVRAEVRALMSLPPGAALLASLAGLPDGPCPDPHLGEVAPDAPAPGSRAGWPCACQLVVAAAWDACASWVAAQGARSVVAIAGPALIEHRVPTGQTIVDPAREELAVALGVSPHSAHNRILAARELLSHPELVKLVEAGICSSWSARLLVIEVESLDAERAGSVVAEMVARMARRHEAGRRRWTPAEIRRATQAARLRLHPETEAQVRRAVWESRKVEVLAGRDGTAYLQAHLDATDAHRIHRRLTALAKGLDDPARTVDQRRADVLTDVLLGARPGAGLGAGLCAGSGDRGAAPVEADLDVARQGAGPEAAAPPRGDPAVPADTAPPTDLRPEICVIVRLDTLLGLAQGSAEVPGLGAIPAETARALAADGTWRAWIADAATGRVVATGSTRYTPSASVARLVRARERECRMPGCRRASSSCDLDHTIAYPAGPTEAHNLGPLCRRHHNLKTHRGWGLTTNGEGWRWRLPSGLVQTDEPDPPGFGAYPD